MFKKIKNFFKIDDTWQHQKYGFKGQRQKEWNPEEDGAKEYQNMDEEDAPLKPQSREVRMENLRLVGLYAGFFGAVVLVFMYQINKKNGERAQVDVDYRANYYKEHYENLGKDKPQQQPNPKDQNRRL